MESYREWKDRDIAFFRKRKDGAQLIAHQAKSKGGPSTLTEWHFSAKLPAYDQLIASLRGSDPATTVRDRCKSLVHQLASVEKMSQREFQEVMGRLEVWGEALVQLRSPREY